MAGFSSWLRGRVGVIAALLLALLAATPSFDAFLCADEGVAVSAASISDGQTQAPDHDLGALHDDSCVHGHCHHGLTFIAQAGGVLAAPSYAVRRNPVVRRAAAASHATFSIERPPRA